MEIFAIVVFALLALFAIVQLVCAIGSARILARPLPALPEDDALPKTAVLLCLRGSDPFLDNCISGLLNQDYPFFDIRIVVDHRDDPAWEVAHEIVARHHAANVRIDELQVRHSTCSLANCGLVQAIASLDESYQTIAILDADVVAHKTWLRELVAPLSDPKIAAATGNRWYMPSKATWAALVRYVYNVGAVVTSSLGKYTWGGSVAIKLDLLRGTDLLATWSKMFGFDVSIYSEAKRQGYEVAFVPSAMMTNRETIYMPECFSWMARQLLQSRLYHPHWPQVLGQAVITSLGILAVAAIIIVSAVHRQWQPAWWAAAGILSYLVSSIAILVLLELVVRRIVRARNEAVDWLDAGVLPKMLVVLPVAQAIWSAATFLAFFMQRVEWRGISYRIDGPYDIHMLEYRPYQSDRGPEDSPVSL